MIHYSSGPQGPKQISPERRDDSRRATSWVRFQGAAGSGRTSCGDPSTAHEKLWWHLSRFSPPTAERSQTLAGGQAQRRPPECRRKPFPHPGGMPPWRRRTPGMADGVPDACGGGTPWHPSGVRPIGGAVFRGYRCAQPPANVCEPCGFGRRRARWSIQGPLGHP